MAMVGAGKAMGRARRAKHGKSLWGCQAGQSRAGQSKSKEGGERLGGWHGRTGQSRQSVAGRGASRAGSRAFFDVPHYCQLMSCSSGSSAGAVLFIYFIIGPFIFYNRFRLYFINAGFLFYSRSVYMFYTARFFF